MGRMHGCQGRVRDKAMTTTLTRYAALPTTIAADETVNKRSHDATFRGRRQQAGRRTAAAERLDAAKASRPATCSPWADSLFAGQPPLATKSPTSGPRTPSVADGGT
jgi:hypothetical protein